jgi:hypothetical protein
VERVIFRAIFTFYENGNSSSCPFTKEYQVFFKAAIFIWDCTILLAGVCTIFSDLDSDFKPFLRRCANSLLAVVLFVDAVSSYIWGNAIETSSTFSFGTFSVVLENQITSCITSQVVIVLHFVFVSFRSRHGRGWAYSPLKFVLDECGQTLLLDQVTPQSFKPNKSDSTAAEVKQESTNHAAPVNSLQQDQVHPNVFLVLRRRLLQYQTSQLARCRAFVIPCIANHQAEGEAFSPRGALGRPFLNFRFLMPLRGLADAHPKFFVCFGVLFLAIPSIACDVAFDDVRLENGLVRLVLNTGMVTMLTAFISSTRHGLDRVAVKHVMSSFRFVTCAVLLMLLVALDVLEKAGSGIEHPVSISANAMMGILFCLCALLDCSPHLSALIQVFISVIARILLWHAD